MTKDPSFPKIGIGILITNPNGEVLIGKRKGSHSPYYSLPGGHFEWGETFEAAAIREAKEETNLTIHKPKVVSVGNGLATLRDEGKHYISINLLAEDYEGELKIMEPDKCEEWLWVQPDNLPTPHFELSAMAIACFLENEFYLDFGGIREDTQH